VLAQNEAICAAVEKSRDYILITNKNHIIHVSLILLSVERDSEVSYCLQMTLIWREIMYVVVYEQNVFIDTGLHGAGCDE